MSKSQRTKGAGGERELCAILSDALGQVVKRKLGQARDSGHDISLSPFYIEVKRRKRVALLYEAMQQAGNYPDNLNHPFGPRPVVMLRADGKEWLVVMRLDDWIKLAREEISNE